MAWTVKYYAEWYDAEGYEHRLEFLEDGFLGTAEELTISGFETDYPEIDFFGTGVSYSCGATIKIITPEPLAYLDDFYVINPLALQVRHYIYDYPDFSTSSSIDFDYLEFVGYLDTEQYEDPISKGSNYEITVTANNGLPILDRLAVKDENGNNLQGVISIVDLLTLLFSKLKMPFNNFFFGFNTSLAPVETTYGSTAYGISPFYAYRHLYVLADNFYDEKNNPISCREAIENILLSLVAKLYIIDNNIYILDTKYITDQSYTPQQVDFVTGNLIGNYELPEGTKQINTIIGQHTLHMLPGKNKVSVNFNKYNFPNPYVFPINEDTISGYKETNDFIDDEGNLAYREVVYENCQNVHKLSNPSSIEFVRRVTSRDSSTGGEFFIRCLPTTTEGFKLQINTGLFITSANQFLGLSGELQWEDPDHYGEENSVGGNVAGWFTFFPGTTEQKDSIVNWGNVYPVSVFGHQPEQTLHNYYQTYHTWINGMERQLWTDNDFSALLSSSDPSEYFLPVHFAVIDYEQSAMYNKWYGINGNINFKTAWPTSADNTKLYNSFVMPLNNPERDVYYTNKGGYLFLQIYIPKEGTSSFTHHLNYQPNFKGLLIKNLSIHLLKENPLTSIEKYDKFEGVPNNDVEFEGLADSDYIDNLEIGTKQGTDLSSFSRGAYYLKVDEDYYDSRSDDERIIRALNFRRGNNTGSLEKLLVNTYLSNLKQSRFSLELELEGYYKPYQSFTYEKIKRDGVPVLLQPVSITVDHKNCRTKFRLEEIIEDDLIT